VFTQLQPNVLLSYRRLTDELNNRYRIIETPRSFPVKFSKRNQKVGETAEEFAVELKVLYDKAHGFRDRKTREEDLVRRFLDGLRDDEVCYEVEYHKEPEAIDDAVLHVVNLEQTRSLRRHRNSTRRACDEDDALAEAEPYKSNEQRNRRKEHITNTFTKFAQHKRENLGKTE
jgi:hypothetical protein